jgi:hypothetical protein
MRSAPTFHTGLKDLYQYRVLPLGVYEMLCEDEVTVVSRALPKSYTLSRALPRHCRLGPRDWRRLWALSLSAAYSGLLLLASLCVATGLLHTAAPSDTSHHHAGSAAHHHAAPDAHHTSAMPDICDIVHQACTALVLWAVPLPTLTLPQGPVPVQIVHRIVDCQILSPFSIRAPPATVS